MENEKVFAMSLSLIHIQMCIRDRVISGNDSLIKECWNGVKKTLDYTLKVWDCDEDGVLEQPQHVTYDTELYGISSMATSIYIAALTAAAEMAEFMEYDDLADRYRKQMCIRDREYPEINKMISDGKPVIQFFMQTHPGADAILFDDELGTYQAVKYLIRNGHKDILMLYKYRIGFPQRSNGYRKAFEEAGLEAVSYTHLDVYKRQGNLSARPGISSIPAECRPVFSAATPYGCWNRFSAFSE